MILATLRCEACDLDLVTTENPGSKWNDHIEECHRDYSGEDDREPDEPPPARLSLIHPCPACDAPIISDRNGPCLSCLTTTEVTR
jgi:hypothetical protein